MSNTLPLISWWKWYAAPDPCAPLCTYRRQVNQISYSTTGYVCGTEWKGGANALIHYFLSSYLSAKPLISRSLVFLRKKIQMKGLKWVQYLKRAGSLEKVARVNRRHWLANEAADRVFEAACRATAAMQANPVDTYRAHRTCGSWPTYMCIRQATERKTEPRGKVGYKNGGRE